jgi:Spy/CpxP family protein refolding chaperone
MLLLMAAALPTFAQPAGPPPPPPPQGAPHPPLPDPVIGMAGPALHGLQLDEEQMQQIGDIVRGHIESGLGDILHEFDQAKRALETAIWTPGATGSDIAASSETVATLARQLELARHDLALDVLELLTEEQRAEFLEMLQAEPPLPGGPGHGGPGAPGGRRGPGPQGP